MFFIKLRLLPCISKFLRVFTMNGCWILSGALSGSMDIIILFLSFGLTIYWTTLFDFLILNQPCPSGINPTWTQCIDFCVVGFGLLIFCWGVFTSKFRSDIGLCGALFYSVFTLSGFGIGTILASQVWLGSAPLLLSERGRIKLVLILLTFGKIFHGRHLALQISLPGDFKWKVQGLFMLSISSEWSFDSLWFSRNRSISCEFLSKNCL